MKKPSPCRLHFLFARSAPVAIVFRRGPSQWVQLIHWNTSTDQLTPGHWFNGRIYERRCDLTPDGSLLVYFAARHNLPLPDSHSAVTWTAISEPPSLIPLALWPKGDSWAGGGAFADDHTLLLNQCEHVPHPDHKPPAHLTVHLKHHWGEDSPLFDQRLLRDGWVLEREGPLKGRKKAHRESWSRWQPTGPWQLIRPFCIRTTPRTGYFKDETFAIRSLGQEIEISLSGAQWADWDQQGRLVQAKSGQLTLAQINRDGHITESILADFNSSSPNSLIA